MRGASALQDHRIRRRGRWLRNGALARTPSHSVLSCVDPMRGPTAGREEDLRLSEAQVLGSGLELEGELFQLSAATECYDSNERCVGLASGQSEASRPATLKRVASDREKRA
jgi:hypothetical protein